MLFRLFYQCVSKAYGNILEVLYCFIFLLCSFFRVCVCVCVYVYVCVSYGFPIMVSKSCRGRLCCREIYLTTAFSRLYLYTVAQKVSQAKLSKKSY